ncbi:hypothetical protein OG730_10445 [Streptomyces sp. NBC_01298]|nr:hypothetical protein OG730_10445 [Streptomyces sp. NBC_01298]
MDITATAPSSTGVLTVPGRLYFLTSEDLSGSRMALHCARCDMATA